MKILHLNSYYIDNHLYSMLYTELDKEYVQTVYIPIKEDREPRNIVNLDQTQLVFSKLIHAKHRYQYFSKIRMLYRDVLKKGLHKKVDFIHAHNLFNDGAVAYKLNKKFGIKYIVAIRMTDVGQQYKYLLHRRYFIYKVLKNAEKVIFIAPKYKSPILSPMPKRLKSIISPKCIVVPNGIHSFWHANYGEKEKNLDSQNIRILYVGQIQRRKNILPLIAAIEQLNEQGGNYSIEIVGDKNHRDEAFFEEFKDRIKNVSWVNYLGRINSKPEMLDAYRRADIFAMPSKNELFGLVYIEALSQGLPIVYLKGEGIDTFMNNARVGEAALGDSPEEIAQALDKISTNYSAYSGFLDIVKLFQWSDIASRYKNMYSQHE